MEKGFKERGLEIHSSRMWDHTQVWAALDFMERYGLTSLIFHKNDLLDDLVFPEKYYSMQYMWDRFAPRYSRTLNRRYYINNVIHECHKRGIRFIMEVKEVNFDEWITELHPEVRNAETGRICPSHPFWWEYMEAKMDELLENVPGFDGIIVSSGTLESKLSISANKCGCRRCRDADEVAWNARLLDIMHSRLREKGKALVVRDFCFSARDQTTILKAVERTSPDIVIAMKNTPHDYYPTFPTNPAIGHSGQREWIEFDTWGQFFGNGVFPVSVVEDMQARMQECRRLGAEGIWLRTDWENMDEHCAFNTMNVLNLIAGAMLSRDVDTGVEDIYREWAAYGMVSPLNPASYDEKPAPVTNGEDIARLRDFMRASWQVMSKTVFVQDHLFQDNSMFPYSMERCFAIMLKIHSMDEWKPGSSGRVTPTEENLRRIFEEKQQAIKEVDALGDILQVDRLDLPRALKDGLTDMLDLYGRYVRCFYLAAQACFLCLRAQETKKAGDRDKTLAVLREAESYGEILRKRVHRRTYTHEVGRLLDCGRLTHLSANIREHLDRIEWQYSQTT